MHAIDRRHLQAMIDEATADFVLINVLPRDAFNQKHIPKSINIPLKTQGFAESVATVLGGRDRKVVVYCSDFDCDASTKAATELEAEGFTDVSDYEGGTRDWFQQEH